MRVGPHVFDVRKARKLAEAGVVGICGEDSQEVRYDPDIGPSVLRETVLHELLHAVWHQTTLDRLYTDEQEEQVLWTLAPRLLALLRDNPELVMFLVYDGE